jgi:ankyrin repeat protein
MSANKLFDAASKGSLLTLQQLVLAGTDINTTNNNGDTALHWAALGDHLDVVKFLHSKGIDINRTNQSGGSALHWAARKGHVEIVRYLLSSGVCMQDVSLCIDPYLRTNNGNKTALDIAEKEHHLEVVKLFYSKNVHEQYTPSVILNVYDTPSSSVVNRAAIYESTATVQQLLQQPNITCDAVHDKRKNKLSMSTLRGGANIGGNVQVPHFNPTSGTYRTPISLDISTKTSGAQIHLTTNGDEPDVTTSRQYIAPLLLDGTGTVTVKAVASKTGMEHSPVAVAQLCLCGGPFTALLLVDCCPVPEPPSHLCGGCMYA